MPIAQIREMRLKNLETLASRYGNMEKLGKRLYPKSGGSMLSQIKNGERPFSEKTARSIEEKLGLRTGWLDEEHMDPRDQAINRLRAGEDFENLDMSEEEKIRELNTLSPSEEPVNWDLYGEVATTVSACAKDLRLTGSLENCERTTHRVYKASLRDGGVVSRTLTEVYLLNLFKKD